MPIPDTNFPWAAVLLIIIAFVVGVVVGERIGRKSRWLTVLVSLLTIAGLGSITYFFHDSLPSLFYPIGGLCFCSAIGMLAFAVEPEQE